MVFKIVEHVIRTYDAPDIAEIDLMRMQDAASYLGVTVFYIRNLLDSGKLKAVIDDRRVNAGGQIRRYVLREEIEQLKRQRDADPRAFDIQDQAE